MRLSVYLKILRAAAVHNNKSVGGREGKEERERRGFGNVTDCLRKIDCQKMAGGAVKLKMPPTGSERERGDVRERCQHQRSTLMQGDWRGRCGKLPDLKPHCLRQGRHSLKPTPLAPEGSVTRHWVPVQASSDHRHLNE